MPLAAVVYRLAPVLTPEFLGQLSEDEAFVPLLETEGSLIDLAGQYVPDITSEELAYLDAMPLALKEAVRVTIRAAIRDGKGLQVQFSPAYDFGLRLWDYGQAISVHVEGPYTESTMPDRMPV
jgi:hypothetical protein